jgi:hypothetical protein
MFAIRKILLSLVLHSVLLVGCSSTPTLSSDQNTPKDDFKTISVDQGVIVGSFLVSTLPKTSGEIEPSFFSGGLFSDKGQYSLWFLGTTFLAAKHNLYATGNKEEFFVKKIPAGFYRFDDIGAGGIHFKLPFKDSFRVEPGKVTYIGRVQVTVPAVLRPGVRFSVVRMNNLEATKAELAGAFPELVSKISLNPADKQLLMSTSPVTLIPNPKESAPK